LFIVIGGALTKLKTFYYPIRAKLHFQTDGIFIFYFMIGIYKITNPSDKIYIGQSVNIEKRINKYKLLDCKNQNRLYNSLLKYGFENHKIEVLCECEKHELNDKERYYQDLYSVINNKGLNCVLVNSNSKSGVISDDTKTALSNSMRGKSKSKNHCANISKSKTGINNPMFGKTPPNKGIKMSDDLKLKLSLQKIGVPSKKKGIKTNKNAYNSIVLLDLNTGVFYYSVSEYAVLNKLDAYCLGKNLKKEYKVNKYENLIITNE